MNRRQGSCGILPHVFLQGCWKPHPHSPLGAALVLVLLFLVLLSGIAVAFLSRVGIETVSASSYSDGVTTRQLAESAVGVVMGQIREATTQQNAAWASQPGMIRVFNTSRALGFYKLYSSDSLVVGRQQLAKYDPAKEVPMGSTGWSSLPALWTDINEPVTRTDANGDSISRFPIVDPEAARPNSPLKVEGFDLATLDPADTVRNGAPMPVRWLYVLRDGTLTAPDRSPDGRTAVWDGASGDKRRLPGKDNPIVGRIAFWTDDDTCKVNINTAGGFTRKDIAPYNDDNYPGSFWDTPRFFTKFDRGGPIDQTTGKFAPGDAGLGLCQPLFNEFQRYPGHPATTSLGMLFYKPNLKEWVLTGEQLYTLLPRLMPGGSEGGTTRKLSKDDEPLPLKAERLYASTDELFFGPRTISSRRQSAEELLKELDEKTKDAVQPQWVDRLRFFLTAHNRSPELNLHGRPRMTIWPVHTNPDLRNPSDKMITFCSVLGSNPQDGMFLMQREDAYSPTRDANIPRNKDLYKYLRDLTSMAIPGFSDYSFASKYGDDRDQILTEIFDYIRCVNLRDSTRDKTLPATVSARDKYKFAPRGIVVPLIVSPPGGKETMGFGRFPTVSEVSLVFYHAGYVGNDGSTYLDPALKPDSGVKANLMRAFLIVETFNPMHGYAPLFQFLKMPDDKTFRGLKVDVDDVQAGRILVHSLAWNAPLTVSGADVQGSVLDFPKQARNEIRWSSGNRWHGRNSGGSEGFWHTIMGKRGGGQMGGAAPKYAFQTTEPIRIAVNPKNPLLEQTFSFSGAKAELTISLGSTVIQTLHLDFPAGTFPVPTDAIWADRGGFWRPNAPNNWGCQQSKAEWAKSFGDRLYWIEVPSGGAHSYAPWDSKNNPNADDRYYTDRWRQILQPGDTVVSLVAGTKSDPRTAAISRNASPFRPHPNYGKPGVRHAQTLRAASGPVYFNSTDLLGAKYTTKFGKLVKTPPLKNYPANKAADLPEDIDGVVRDDGMPGDFDTGIGDLPDGAFCGKADEGNLAWRHPDQYGNWVYTHPYFTWDYEETFDTFFSANRQVPSAILFGSLLSGRTRDWETLCFSPFPAGDRHRGLTQPPKDHLLLDLFHMPIVEPYAISEPFSTAGKVNLNAQLAPFPWIRRTTALRAALHATRVTAVPAGDVDKYKTGVWNAAQNRTDPRPENYRHPIDLDQTIAGLEHVFTEYPLSPNRHRGFYKSASEICDRFLYPKGVKFEPGEAAIRTFWRNNTLTGDNVREKPYADLYPRLTTKSNSYTVHLRVQRLHQPRGETDADYLQWRETPELVGGEYRGETAIERYIDPHDRRFEASHPEAINFNKESLESAYRFRVVHSKRFVP